MATTILTITVMAITIRTTMAAGDGITATGVGIFTTTVAGAGIIITTSATGAGIPTTMVVGAGTIGITTGETEKGASAPFFLRTLR
jgi:hypothetical protein